ncbi:MAG TPA: alpha-galactosidase, partial [Tepidisphaeraceae bacterium]
PPARAAAPASPSTRPLSDALPARFPLATMPAAPYDSIVASPDDIAAANAWAAAAFGGKPAPSAVSPATLPTSATAPSTTRPAADLLFGSRQVPFSFVYGKTPSAQLLGRWRHEAATKDRVDCVEYTGRWTDPDSGLSVVAVAVAYKNFPAVDWVLTFENLSKQDTPVLQDIQPLDVRLNLPAEGPAAPSAVLHRIAGDNCSADSFKPLQIPIKPGEPIHLAPAGGRSSNGTFPFFNIAAGDEGMFAAIGWTGQWAASLERSTPDSARLRAGMERTHLILHPGEKIRTPRILLMAWRGDRMDAHNLFRRLMLRHYSPQIDGRPVALPAFLQCFDRYKGDAAWSCEAGQIQQATAARDMGCEGSWLDAEWFPGGFPNGVGNWTTHERFPRGLKPISDACHRMDMRFMAWFEPERVAADSQIATEHPQFVNGGKGGGLFKLDDPAARRWLTDLLLQRIKEFGLDWYRNDFNMDPLDTWRSTDTPDRQGMTEIRYVEGLYEMWDELRAKNPGLVIDNCASGGRRIDLEMCRRSVVLWQSDINCQQGSEDAHQAQNVCLSLYIPLHTPCAWQPDIYELRSVVTAGLVLQLPYRQPGFAADQTRKMVEEVKGYRKFWYGDLYPLTAISPAKDRSFAFELFRPDLREGIVMAFRRPQVPEAALPLLLKGLDPKAEYWVESVEGLIAPARMRGEELMKTGIVLKLPGPPAPRASDVIRFRDVQLKKS